MNNLDQKFRLKNLTTKKFSLQVDFYTIILVQEGKGIFYLDDEMMALKALIESNYNIHHSPSFYAKALGIPINTLTKKCKKHFGRSPRDLIQKRIIVEAKRRLHLTRQLVKQISYELNFKDEYYFSRFFKKRVNMSPIAFREAVGIARVADLSILNP